jgi:flavin-dependent dehydrogenase
VTLLERSRYDAFRIGETLPPAVKGPLIELGLLDQFLDAGPLESPGVISVWGQPERYENDYIFNPDGAGWHVDRRCFDAMLARAAAAVGAEILTGATAVGCLYRRSALWQVEAVVSGVALTVHARILVDATGRAASPARRLAGHRVVHDRLVGLVGITSPRRAVRCPERRTLIEAVETGWWYSAPLPDGRRMAAFMTDGDLVPAGEDSRARFLGTQLERAEHARAVLGDGPFEEAPWVAAASSSGPVKAAGRGWLAVGDAAASFDPLSQQGVTWALESGLEAARAIEAHLRGCAGAFDRYARWVGDELASYLRIRAFYYDQERRWPDARFWCRRRSIGGFRKKLRRRKDFP